MSITSVNKYTDNIGFYQTQIPVQVTNTRTDVHTKAQLVSPPKTEGLKGKEDLKKKAKNKYFSNALAFNLMNTESRLTKGYKRTFFDCSSVLVQEGKKIRSTYCNAR